MVVLSAFDQLIKKHIGQMKQYNEEMLKALEDKEFNKYYQLNLEFHDYFLNLSPNKTLRSYITPMKQRLYDFTWRSYVKAWELVNIEEHRKFIRCIEDGDREGAANVMKDEHWGWTIHESHGIQCYELN